MKHLLHNLIAVAVLAHAIFGCCAHHECHAEETSNLVAGSLLELLAGSSLNTGHSKSDCSSRHKEHQHRSGQENPEPTTPTECGHCNCSWLLSDVDTVDFDLIGIFNDCFCTLEAASPTNACCVPRQLAEHFIPQPHWSGLRAHLAMSILLI